MKCRLATLCAALLLCSCYTNLNQAWFEKKYEGYLLDYNTDEASGLRGLPPRLYRAGQEWYIAAVRSDVQDHDKRVHAAGQTLLERHTFTLTPQQGRPIFYHKITPEMAYWMLRSDDASDFWFSDFSVKDEIEKAGGEWLPALPPGAKAVDAEYLKYCRSSANYVQQLPTDDPWYAYPMAGLTFLCVDLPCSIAITSVVTAAFVGVAWLESKADDDDDDDDDSFIDFDPTPSKPSKPQASRPHRPHKGSHADAHHKHHKHGKHHSGGSKNHHKHSDKKKDENKSDSHRPNRKR